MSSQDKTARSANVFNGPTTVSPSPFGPKTDAAAQVNLMDLEVTVPVHTGAAPGAASTAASPIAEILSLISDRRPDLVEALLNIDRTYRQQAEAALKAQVTRQQQQLDELMKRTETLLKSARDIADDAVEKGLDKQRLQIDNLLDRIDKQLSDTNAAAMRIDKLFAEAQHASHEVLEEARKVGASYKPLLDKSADERAALSRDLEAARAHATKEHERLAETRADLNLERQRVHELETQVNEALASRDRIALQVREVEAKLEGTVIPLRQELETLREREAQARVQLEAARKEIAGLRLISPPPRQH